MKKIWSLIIILGLFICVFSDSGGPDEFGYQWVDSDEAGGPVFNWIEISTTGTRLTALDCDDCYTWLDLPEAFEFYGISYSQMVVTSNGYLSFDEDATYFPISSTYSSFPDSDSPNAIIAPYNFDQDPADSPGAIYYQHFDGYTVIEWYEICQYPGSGSYDPSTWEVILKYSTKEIIFQYLHTANLTTTLRMGIENEDGTIGLNMHSWSGDPPDSFAIRTRATPIAAPPYFDNFEWDTGDFTIGEDSEWERGPVLASSPVFPPHSGGRCYGTVLDGDYVNNADWSLYPPHIDATTAEWPIMDFWHFYQTEEGHDGGVVEVSTDEGGSWFIIEPEEGYPTAMTDGPLAGSDAFSGYSDGWLYSSFDLSDFSGQEIMVRFRLVSDDANTDLGWYIDDFGYHQAYGVLHGNVDLAYFEPDSGARVEIPTLGLTEITDTAGYFIFDTVTVGTHYVRVTRDHFVPRDSISFTVDRFDTVYLNILLAPELYNEDFEETNGDMVPDPPEGWEWGTPTVGPDSAHSGVKCWGTKLGQNYESNAHWKLTLQVPLYEVNWPLLSFYTWYKFEEGFYGTFPDGGNIKASVDSGTTWEIVRPVGGYDGTIGDHNLFMPLEPAFGDDETGDFWHEVYVPLYDYSDYPVIWISFEIGTDASITNRGWYIDDIRIADDSTYAGVNELTKLPQNFSLSATPNPFNSSCRITYNLAEDAILEIFDISGKQIFHREISAGVGSILWSPDDIPSGIYFARLHNSTQNRIVKISLVR